MVSVYFLFQIARHLYIVEIMAHVRRRITVKITHVNAPMAGLVATVNNLVMIRSFLTVASSDSIQRIVDKLFINASLVTKISVYKKGETQVKMYFYDHV